MSVTRLFLGVALAAVLAPPLAPAARAEDAAAPVPPLALFGPLPAAAPAPVSVDESALRYYASQNDAERVAAEIRRLQTENPGWSPPSDLYAADPAPKVDVTPLWALFSAGRYADLHAELDRLKAADPGFTPPADLADALADAEGAARIVAASDAGNAAGVVAAARARPTLLVCSRLDVVWRVAEALAREGDTERSVTAYDYALGRCASGPERLATVQKAALVLPDAAVDRLVAKGAVQADGTNEFQAVLDDRVRRRVAAAIPPPVETPAVAAAAPTTAAGGDPLLQPLFAAPAAAPAPVFVAPAAPADLARLETMARTARSSGDAGLLGWYAYGRGDLETAESWFRTAASFSPDPKAVEGLVLTLQRKGDQRAAEDLAYRTRALSPDLNRLFVEVTAATLAGLGEAAYPDDRLAAMEAAVTETRSAFGAEALGWYRYNTKGFAAAKTWFATALAVKETEGAHLGEVLTAQRLGERKRAADLLAALAPRYPALAALKESAATAAVSSGDGSRVKVRLAKRPKESGGDVRQAVALYEGKRYREAIGLLEKIAASGKETQDLAVLKGWAYYNVREYAKARQVFQAADTHGSTPQTRTGLYYARQQTRAPFYQR